MARHRSGAPENKRKKTFADASAPLQCSRCCGLVRRFQRAYGPHRRGDPDEVLVLRGMVKCQSDVGPLLCQEASAIRVISPVNGNLVQRIPIDLGRDTSIAPSWYNPDVLVIKNTHITASTTLQFRAEFFNMFNHATFGSPNSTLGNSGFGYTTWTATAEREIQFGLRLLF